MRNLKRALSLTLASVMLLGMMVVGSSALSFNDADDISNVTAASVLEDLGIMQGDGSGNFMPDKAVTRAQMAIIVCRILYGNKLNVSQFEGTTQYTDVGTNDYYTGYINLATQLGIIGGYGDGRFGPNDTVTTAQAALMLSRALGYFKGNEIAQATDWALASIAQATKINMFGNLNLPTNAELARDNVAEMVFNTISKAVPVQYNELLGVYYNENQGIIYSLEFNYLQTLGYKNFDLVYRSNDRDMYGRPATTWGVGRYNAGNSTTSSGTITKTDNLTNEGGLLPSLVRLQEKDEIITVPNAPTYVYTDKTKEKDVYKNLGKSVCTAYANKNNDPGYEWTAFINGKEVETAADSYGKALIPGANSSDIYRFTAKGTQTEIYIDDDEQTVDVIEINYYIGQVSSVKEDKDGRYVTVKELSKGSDLDVRTFYTANYAEEDYVIYTIDYIEDDDDYIIAEMFEPEIVTGEVNRVESDKDTGDTYLRFERDSTKYPYSRFSVDSKTVQQQHMVYDLDDLNVVDHPALKTDYDLLMDPNGYVVAFREANQKPNQYLYVKDSDEELKDWVAKVLLTDVTSPKVEVKDELSDLIYNDTDKAYNWTNPKTLHVDEAPGKKIDWTDYKYVDTDIKGQKDSNIDHMIWKYTVSDSGVYTLKFVNPVSNWTDIRDQDTQWRMTGASIKTGKAYVTGVRSGGTSTNEFIVDAKTIFVDDVNDKVYTGYKEVPNVENAEVAYVLNKGVAKVVFILDGEIYDDGNVFFMLKDTDRETFKYDGDNYWDFENAYVNGEHQSHWNVRYNALNNGEALKAGRLYEVKKTIEDGEYITEIREWTNSDGVLPQALLTINAVGDETFWLRQYDEDKVYKYDTEGGDNPTQIVLVEYDADDNLDNITVGRLSDMKDGLITSEKNIQKDVNEKNVQMETVAVVVKAKSSNASEKDYTTARIVYIVVRPLWYNAVNKATGGWEKHYYERSLVSNNDDYSWTKLDLTNVDLTGGKTITSIEVYDENGKLITTVTGDYIRTVDDDVFANLPKEGAEIVIKTSAGSQVGEGNITVTNTAEAEITGITFNGDAVADVDALADKEAKIGDTIVMNIAGKVKVAATGATVTNEGAVYTFTATDDTGVTITIEKDESVDKAKLTLIGSLLTAPGIKVVEGTSTVLTGKTETTVVNGAIVEQVVYDVTPGAAVTIGSGAFGNNTKSYDVDGTMVTINDATNSDSITFTMPEETLTLNLSAADTFTDSEGGTAGAKTAIYVADGVTGLKWRNNGDTADVTPVSEAGTGSNKGFTIYYVDTTTTDRWSADVDTINVTAANVKHGTIIAANTTASGGTEAASATPYIYPAVKVTLAQDATASYDKSATSTPNDQSVNTSEGVVPGTMLKIGVTTQTDVIVGEAGDVGASVKTTGYTYEMPTTELKLVGGFKVTLDGGVTATIDSKPVTSGQVVTDLTNNLTAVAPAGMTIVKGTKSVSLAADKYADAAVAADVTLNAAWELTLGADKGIEILYRSQPSNKEQKPVTGTEGTAIEKIYVVDDLTIEVTGTNQLVVKDGSNAEVDFTTYDKDGFNTETDYDAGAFWVKIKITENTKGWSIDGKK